MIEVAARIAGALDASIRRIDQATNGPRRGKLQTPQPRPDFCSLCQVLQLCRNDGILRQVFPASVGFSDVRSDFWSLSQRRALSVSGLYSRETPGKVVRSNGRAPSAAPNA